MLDRAAMQRATGWALVDQVAVSGGNFLTGIMLARALGLAEFGTFTLMWMVAQFGGSVQHALITAPMMSIGPKQANHDAAAYYGVVLAQQVAFSALSFGLVFWGTRTACPFLDGCGPSLSWPLASAVAAMLMQDFLRRYFFALGRGAAAFVNDALCYLSRLAALAIAFRAGATNVEAVLWIHAGAYAAAFCLGIVGFDKIVWRVAAFGPITRRHWTSARWLAPSALLQWTSGNLFLLAAGAMLGVASLGAIRAAQNLFGLTHILLQGFDNVLPRSAAIRLRDGGTPALRAYLGRVGLACVVLAAAFGLVAAAFPEFWLRLFYGGEFASHGYLLQWYAAVYVLTFAIVPLRIGLRALEHTRPLFWAYVVATAFTAVAVVPLIDAFGASGAMAGILATQVAMLAILARSFGGHARRRGVPGSPRPGLLVAFLGPDGSGKSTVIRRVAEQVSGEFGGVSIRHLRPRAAPARAGTPVREPHAHPPYGMIASAVKVGYFALDYWLGHWSTIGPLLGRGHLVIFDRYFHDMLVDPLRYRYGGPRWLVRCVARLVPQPDLWVLLDASPEVLWARKPELATTESRRQRCLYQTLADRLPNAVCIDAERALEAVVDDVIRRIHSHALAEHRRHGGGSSKGPTAWSPDPPDATADHRPAIGRTRGAG